MLLGLAIASMLAACGGRGGGHVYATPGPPEDPWGPYIHEAGARFAVPETWIREVMRQESGGQQYLGGSPTTSPAGAMGLMQVMPSTYETLREEYGLGSDPYDPHDNILAGTAYIREMYDRYGSPGFLAAYNAGPRRVDDYLNGARNLPGETRNYVAAIAPRIQGYAAYATVAPVPAARSGQTQLADAMEPIRSSGDAAIAPAPAAIPQDAAPGSAPSMEPIRSPGDPGYAPAPAQAPQAAPPIEAARMEPLRSPGDPGMPQAAGVSTAPAATPAGGYGTVGPASLPQPGTTSLLAQARGTAPAATAAAPQPPPQQQAGGFHFIPQAMADTPPRAPGRYAIQVGAFASPSEARTAAEEAKGLASTALGAETLIGPVARRDGSVLFRARLGGLQADAAQSACRRVLANGRPCTIVPPDGS